MEVLSHHIHTPPPSLSAAGFQSLWLVELEGLVERLLQKDPRDRPQSAAELRRLILAIDRRLPADVQVAMGDDASSEAPTMAIAYDAITRQEARSVSFSPTSSLAGTKTAPGGAGATTVSAPRVGSRPPSSPAQGVLVAATPPEPRRSSATWILAAALLAAGAGAAGTYLAYGRGKDAPVPSTTVIPPSTTSTPPGPDISAAAPSGAAPSSSVPSSPMAVAPAAPVGKGAAKSTLSPIKAVAGPPLTPPGMASAVPASGAPVPPTPGPHPTSPATTGKPAIDDRT